MWRAGAVLFFISNVVAVPDFPDDFKFGASTASYQVEGAWNVSGRTPSIWDEFVHKRPEAIAGQTTGDVACDSYHLWKRDVEMISEIGLQFYRFSLSWNRLFPNGFTNRVNEDGRRYYSDLIDALIDKGVEPVVTLFHWDLPQNLQDLGGWTNPLIADWFSDYARAVYSLFGDRVTTWITINEPIVICDVSYQMGLYAPGILSPGIGNYICIKNLLIAHARAWRIYDEEFKPKYKGRVSITNHHLWFDPAEGVSDSVAELARQLCVGMYSHPIYSAEGGWPPAIEAIVANKSASQGYKKSRLPAFTEEEKRLIKGTFDFYGFNYYTGRLVRPAGPGEETGAWPLEGSSDLGLVLSVNTSWTVSGTTWFYIIPNGLRKQLKWLKDQYGDVEVMITENGYADLEEGLHDPDRVEYFRDHLQQVLESIHEDGVHVSAYTAWSLMDNFEWYNGYVPKFGLYSVDFSSPGRARSPRSSAHYYSEVIRLRSPRVVSAQHSPLASLTTVLIFMYITQLI